MRPGWQRQPEFIVKAICQWLRHVPLQDADMLAMLRYESDVMLAHLHDVGPSLQGRTSIRRIVFPGSVDHRHQGNRPLLTMTRSEATSYCVTLTSRWMTKTTSPAAATAIVCRSQTGASGGESGSPR